METKRKFSIIIVDDDPGMGETMVDILGDMGYGVYVAMDGCRAIEMIKDKTYDAVLMDIKMPGINGVETLKEVKRISPTTRVMMMTAYSVEALVKEALKEGAYGIIHKPLNIDRVVSFIEKTEKGSLIMVVDDDLNSCETLKDVLEERSYTAGIAHNGEEAVKVARENTVDIIFIDVKMPVLNGLETYREIKKLNPETTAVMMTGYRQEVKELVEEALSESVYTCLYKPLDMDKVVALIEEISGQKTGGTLRKPDHGDKSHG